MVAKNKPLFLFFLFIAVLLIIGSFLTNSVGSAQTSPIRAQVVRVIESDESGLSAASGLTYFPAADALVTLSPSGQSAATEDLNLILVGRELGQQTRTFNLTSPVSPATILAFDRQRNSLYMLDPLQGALLQIDIALDGSQLVGKNVSKRFGLRDQKLSQTKGMSISNLGEFFFLDDTGQQVSRMSPDLQATNDGQIMSYNSDTIDLGRKDASGSALIAFNPENEHLYSLASFESMLYEHDSRGRLVGVHDLSEVALNNVRGLAFAPSGDSTDDSNEQSLYLINEVEKSESGEVLTTSLVELDLNAVTITPMANQVSTLIQVIDASRWNPASPDPAGIDYCESTNRLIVGDSEVDEMNIYKNKNVFESSLTGALQRTTDTTHFSNEPTGVGYNKDNGYLYFSDDTGSRYIHEVKLDADCFFGLNNAVRSITTKDNVNNKLDDPEGVAYGAGKLFISDGVDKEVWIIRLGADGQFGTNDDVVEGHFDTEGYGLQDPEGIDYIEDSGNLIIVSRRQDFAIEVTQAGDLVNTIDFASANIDKPAGVAYAPRSNDVNLRSLYIVDRGVDNGADPNENDGKIYEITYDGPIGPTATPSNTPTSTPTNTPGPSPTPSPTPTSSPTPIPGVNPEVDNVSVGSTIGTSLSLSHTTSGSDRLMLVGVSINNDNFEVVNSVTYNGNPLTYVNSETQSDDARVEIWQLVNPPIGTYDVLINFSADLAQYAVAGVVTFTGVDQTNPLGTFAGNNATSSTANVVVPSAPDNMVLAVFSCETCTSLTVVSPTIEQWNVVLGGSKEIGVGGTVVSNSSSTSIDATLGVSDHWAVGGIAILPASGGGPPNNVPVATPDNYSVEEDNLLSVPAGQGVLNNDNDDDNDPLTAVLVSDVSNGTLNLSDNGSFTYDPVPNFNGTDSFTYKANDGQADSNTVTVSINVTPVNDIPVASPNSYSVTKNNVLNVPAPGVLIDDTDDDGEGLTAILVTDVISGQLNLISDGSFAYTPNTDFVGTDSFTYKANDGTTDSNTVMVTINVLPTNDPPEAFPDAYSVAEDGSLIISAATGVLFNDTDPDDDLLSAVLVSNVNNGTLNLAADGSFTYDPALNFNGQDSFTYKANDGLVDSNIVTVTIDVNPINDAPEATVDGYSMDSNTTLTVPAPGVLENDTDVEGSALTAVLVSDVSTGTLNFNADGSFFYSPTLDFEGEASFTYEANDGLLDSAVTNVTITVNAVNEVVINSISPDFGIPGDSFSVTVTGSGFMTGATLSFANGTGPAPTASGFDVALDGTSLSADITIKNGGPRRNRTWSVQVTNPDGSAGVLVDSFTIIVQ